MDSADELTRPLWICRDKIAGELRSYVHVYHTRAPFYIRNEKTGGLFWLGEARHCLGVYSIEDAEKIFTKVPSFETMLVKLG